MAANHSEVVGLEPFFVSQLNSVVPARRQLAEEAVQISHELRAMLVVGGVEAAELDHEQADFVAEWFTGLQERIDEQLSIEEGLVWLSSPNAEAGQIGEPFQRDIVGHFEGEQEVARNLLDQSAQILGGGKLVVSSIHADRLERLGILVEAVPFEPGLGKFPSVVVTLFVVDLSRPTGVFPRACSDEDVAGGEALNR